VVSDSTSATTIQAMANIARVASGTGYIVKARLSTDLKSITPRIRVHLFSASNPTVVADNVQWKDLYADVSKRLGYFDLPAMTTGADTIEFQHEPDVRSHAAHPGRGGGEPEHLLGVGSAGRLHPGGSTRNSRLS
jgi:hypothetical protein